jgi:glycerophosphoryl diester phosphodiesterase
LSVVVFFIAKLAVPGSESPLWWIVLSLGLILLLFFAVNIATNLIAVLSFAVLLVLLYTNVARTDAFHLPETEERAEPGVPKFTRARLLAGLAIGILVAALIGMTAVHSIDLEDRVEITAHRGASGKAPENTLASIRQAIADDADWVEIDVQESKDGVVVVAHDSDLKKVSGEDIKIWEGTAEELRSIDIGSYFDPKFKDERVPTLAEVLEICRENNARLNIELKYYGHDQNLEQKVVDLVEQHEMENSVVIMSLDADGIKKLKALRPDWTAGLLTAVTLSDLTRAEADFLAVKTTLATRPFISSAHRHNKDVFVWTVNDPVTMSVMIGRGADNLITDHPALARRVLAERAEMSPVERILLELSLFLGEVPEPTEDELRP